MRKKRRLLLRPKCRPANKKKKLRVFEIPWNEDYSLKILAESEEKAKEIAVGLARKMAEDLVQKLLNGDLGDKRS